MDSLSSSLSDSAKNGTVPKWLQRRSLENYCGVKALWVRILPVPPSGQAESLTEETDLGNKNTEQGSLRLLPPNRAALGKCLGDIVYSPEMAIPAGLLKLRLDIYFNLIWVSTA